MKYSLIYLSVLVVFAVAGLGLAASPATAAELAKSADGFVDTIGVVTHLKFSSGTNSYTKPQVLTMLGQLGIRNIRDDMPLGSSLFSRFYSLYNTNGIRVCWNPYTWDRSAPSIIQIVSTLRTNACMRFFEGANEPDLAVQVGYAPYTYNGFTDNPPPAGNTYAGTQAWQDALYAAVKADSLASNTPVISPPMGFSINAQYMNPISMDYETMHSYPGGKDPTNKLDVYNIGGVNLMTTPPKPIVVTETGFHTAMLDTNTHPPVSQLAHGKYLPRLFAEYFNRGIVNTYSYEFMDEGTDSTTRQQIFGMVNYNMTPKPAFTNLQNLITLLEEASWNTTSKTWSVPGFTPSALDYALAGSTNNVHHTLLQKSTGEFYLLLWQEVKTFNNDGGPGNMANWKDITNAPVAVTLTLTTPMANAATYLLGSLTPTATYVNPSSLSLSVPDEIMVIRLMPPAQPLASFSGSPTRGLVPLTVLFTASSTGSITNWFWDFGDGGTTNTTALNVNHVYTRAGTYSVSLVVSGSNGSSTNALTNYIAVVTNLPSALPARWSFDTGTVADLISDTGAYTFAVAGAGTPTYHAGSVSLPSNAELVATGINSTNLPNLTNTATVWARMKFDAVPNPALITMFFLGLMNATAPADYAQAALVAQYKTNSVLNGGTGGTPITLRGRVITNGVTIPYEQNFAAFPGTNVYFTVAVTLTAGQDANGNPNPGKTRFQLFINGSLVGSGSQDGPNVIPILALCLGELKASGGVAVTFDEVQVWDQTLMSNQIAQIEWPTASPDVVTTPWNVPVTVSPLANDVDLNSYPLTVVSVSPANATASIIGGTNVLITPTLGAAGMAYVAYAITNGNGGSDSSLITVTVTTPPRPVITLAVNSGSAIVLSGSNGSAKGIYQVLSSTNLALPVANWTPILTNTFDAGGGFNVTNTIDPASPAQFLLFKQ